MIQFDEHTFQKGWLFNHQLAMFLPDFLLGHHPWSLCKWVDAITYVWQFRREATFGWRWFWWWWWWWRRRRRRRWCWRRGWWGWWGWWGWLDSCNLATKADQQTRNGLLGPPRQTSMTGMLCALATLQVHWIDLAFPKGFSSFRLWPYINVDSWTRSVWFSTWLHVLVKFSLWAFNLFLGPGGAAVFFFFFFRGGGGSEGMEKDNDHLDEIEHRA